ncbi:MAG: tetratricopeptide repeat protein [Aliifodinibius sp.]|nr:tetratricopeptide repeat protein [Fodinibius sp.]NIY26944.1 tetratricopeptide repeat protein [Fodinibius sp.]
MTESVENDPSKQRGEESSNCLNAHFRSGQIEYNRGNLQEALNHLQAETRTHPDNWSAYYMIGEIYNLMENESAAEEAFLEAYNICRDDVKLLYSLARLYFDTDRLEESVKYLEIIQSIDRDFIEAYRLRGEINFRLGEYREACDAFTNIAMRNPNDPEVWNNLGNSHFKLEEFEQARQCYEKVIEIDSTYSMAYRNLAVCEIRLNNFENAYGILKEYLELASEDYNMIVMAAEIAINLEKFDEARDYIDKALGINPNSPQLLMLLGDCYYAAGLLESSKIQFEQALQIDPKFNQARQRLMQIIEIQDARKR